jgi:preprotein translocase subunit SecA
MEANRVLPAPGLIFGAYPEKALAQRAVWPRIALTWPLRRRADARFLASVERHAAALDSTRPEAALSQVRARLRREGFSDDCVAASFAVIRAVTARELNLRHYDCQLLAARIMLANRLAEMQTGEGKTLAALLTAATAALAGIPVHVVTANDYLAQRDAESLMAVYAALGLSVACIVEPHDAAARRAAYACDVTYITARELVFDYLRDRVALGGSTAPLRLLARGLRPHAPLLLRGLCMALVDEADSILIDDARTPAILAAADANAAQHAAYRQALQIARQLWLNQDFRLDTAALAVTITARGQQKIDAAAEALDGGWRNTRQRHEWLNTALAALHLFQRDRHYLVRDGAIAIIDAETGRAAPGRAWSRGLHQMVELKEGCATSSGQQALAQISFQRFFPRYHRLCGMSGTLVESRRELVRCYALAVTRVPLHRPCRRLCHAPEIHLDGAAKWRAVVAAIAREHAVGRAVLVGTASVAESEQLSTRLADAGLPHCVLNARNDAAEAAIVAHAGEPGRITIATNMAGRGTDIALHPEVRARGGLHVIATQLNNSRRIDRQLAGRSARQGDPGSVATLIALDDALPQQHLPHGLRALLAGLCRKRGILPIMLGRIVLAWVQRQHEWQLGWQRRVLQRQDETMEQVLSVGRHGV